MRIALRFKQVQSRSRAACSTDAIHATRQSRSTLTQLACRSGLFRRLCRTRASGRLGGYLVQPAAQAQHVRPLVPALLVLPRDVRRATDKQQVQASAKAKPRHSGYPAKHCAGYPAKHRGSPAHR
jgi:hypothetical protein